MRLEDTGLFHLLRARCADVAHFRFSGEEWLALVTRAAREMANVLNRACVQFEDYTLHDEQHAVRVIHWMHSLIPEDVKKALSAVDIALLILSAYGHDTGMSVGREGRDHLMKSDEYKDFLLSNEGGWIEAEQARESNDLTRYEHLTSRLFQEFLRGKHHEISADLMVDLFAKELDLDGHSLSVPLAALCRSHGQSIVEIAELRPEPFAGDFLVDTAFLACVLRLADYIDLDPARAPRSLMDWIQPGNATSYREWRKHQATRFFVNSDTIQFTARFNDFFEEKVLRDTLDGLDRERRDCMELLDRRGPDVKLRLALRTPIVRRIESVGYLYEEFQFRLENKQIVSLLMGTRLYRDERVFVRELFQNALDACRHAEAAGADSDRHNYKGKISFRRYFDPNKRQEVVEVSDNGSGMTRPIIRDYFMRVGRSFYQSFAFRRRGLDFEAVSQFGIGILSCFMKADYIEVETKPDLDVHAEDGQVDKKGLKLEIRGPHEFFVVKVHPRPFPGTSIKVFLRTPMTESLVGIVERFVGRVPYAIEVQERAEAASILPGIPFDFSDERFQFAYVERPGSFRYASRDLEFAGKFGFELKGFIRFFLFDVQGTRHLRLLDAGKYSFVGFGPDGETILHVKQLTQEDRQSFGPLLERLRGFQQSFSGDVRNDFASLLRLIDRIYGRLSGPHDTSEVNALQEALQAQIEVLRHSPGFRSNPKSAGIQKHLAQAVDDIKSFISGKISLPAPTGILTQDGINLGGIVDLRPRLKFGIGFLYNLDLCGKYRLSLTASRDAVIFDGHSEALIGHIASKAGDFLGQWFREERIPAEEVAEFLKSVAPTLAEAVRRSYEKKISK